jgi:NADH-quinone oxidoreductase subunit J
MYSNTVATLFFYFFAVSSIALAMGVVLGRRLLRSAVCLIGVLGCSAGFTVILGFEFVAAIQVLVFIGGIVVLLLFGIMMTSEGQTFERLPSASRKAVGGLVSTTFFAITLIVYLNAEFQIASTEGLASSHQGAAMIGRKLLSNERDGYIVPFEVISLLLLTALIGGIVIARKRDPEEE